MHALCGRRTQKLADMHKTKTHTKFARKTNNLAQMMQGQVIRPLLGPKWIECNAWMAMKQEC